MAHCKCESAGGREAATGAVFSSSRGTEAASSICTGGSTGGWSSSICETPMISLKHPDHIIWSCCLYHLQVCTSTFSSTMSEPPLLPHWLGRQKHLWRSLWKHLTEKDTARVIAGKYGEDNIFADETGNKQQAKPEKVGFWGRVIWRPWKAFYLLNVNHNTSGSTWTFLEKKQSEVQMIASAELAPEPLTETFGRLGKHSDGNHSQLRTQLFWPQYVFTLNHSLLWAFIQLDAIVREQPFLRTPLASSCVSIYRLRPHYERAKATFHGILNVCGIL